MYQPYRPCVHPCAIAKGAQPDKVDHALDDHARTSLQDVSALCGMCNDEYPPLVPIGGCGKTCCNGADPLMPDTVFDEPDELALLQAQDAYARRATYGVVLHQGYRCLGVNPLNQGADP